MEHKPNLCSTRNVCETCMPPNGSLFDIQHWTEQGQGHPWCNVS